MHEWYFLIRVILLPLLLGLPVLMLVWALWRWWHTAPLIIQPAWRSYVAFIAITLGGISSLLWLVSIVWAGVIGGFAYYDPVVLRFYRWGFFTGVAGFLISFAGKGKLRWPACGLSFLMAMLWMMAATSE